MKTSEIKDPDVKEVFDTFLMLQSAKGYVEYASQRYDALTNDQKQKAISYLMAIPQRELIELVFNL